MIEIEGLTHRYRKGNRETTALEDVTLTVEQGEFVCLCGHSGSGKTTLLLATGAMLRPSEGTVRVAGTDVYSLSPGERAAFRAKHIGFVFQMFHLVPYLDITKNVLLAGGRGDGSSRVAEATEMLSTFGLGHRATHRPEELSAGERQRAAVARALFARPSVVLADEPTGNLDPDNGKVVLDLLADYHERGGTVLLVTHGPGAESHADRVVHLDHGRLLASDQNRSCPK